MMKKQAQRELYKIIRQTVTQREKADFDKQICTRFINSDFFKFSNLILIYVSVGSEIDTYNIIEYILRCGKRVAVPRCTKKQMDFYEIESLSELQIGAFGIPEPINSYKKIRSFKNSVCVVPALSFDSYGDRLGYGGGYYDRFLSSNQITTVGFCYERCLSECISHEAFDMKIDFILTENGFRNSKNKEVLHK